MELAAFSLKQGIIRSELFKGLLGVEAKPRKSLSEFEEFNLPLVGDFPEFDKQSAQTKEELLVKTVVLAKKDSLHFESIAVISRKTRCEFERSASYVLVKTPSCRS